MIGADGVRSKARELVLGFRRQAESPVDTLCFRAWFTNEEMIKDPETKRFCENGDTFNGWIGPDVHFSVLDVRILCSGELCVWC